MKVARGLMKFHSWAVIFFHDIYCMHWCFVSLTFFETFVHEKMKIK